jgi:hypothetical protein
VPYIKKEIRKPAVSSSHIVLLKFNTDYRWNVYKRGEWYNLDGNANKRIAYYVKKKTIFSKKIFYENSKEFFNLI